MNQSFLQFVETLEVRDNVATLNMDELAARAKPMGTPTTHGGLAFFSNVRNRSGAQAVVLGSDRVRQRSLTPLQKSIVDGLDATLANLREYLTRTPLVCVKRTIGANELFNPKCTLFLSTQRRDNIRQAYLWASTLREWAPGEPGPELRLVCVPEWPDQDRQVLAFPEDGLVLVLGSDYVGEVKMGFLRMAMWWAKQEGMLSVHSGSKLIKARGQDGRTRRYGMLLFGLSGTGKTTHSCHDHGLDGEGEGIEVLQDDIVFLKQDGSALGTEQGFYLKTEGIKHQNQPIISDALAKPGALFENVMVDHNGNVDLADLSLGSNGRAVIPRQALAPHISASINLPSLDELDGLVIGFVTRRMTVLPIASSLSPESAAAAFMLGESIETSAGDPRRAGESVRVVGTNPFLIGSEAEEGNWFYDFLKRHEDKVQCYLLNTGGIGQIMERDPEGRPAVSQETLRVAIPEMASIIRGIFRGSVVWEAEPHFGNNVLVQTDGLDMGKFSLDRFYTEDKAGQYVDVLKRERREWLAGFHGLREGIAEALP